VGQKHVRRSENDNCQQKRRRRLARSAGGDEPVWTDGRRIVAPDTERRGRHHWPRSREFCLASSACDHAAGWDRKGSFDGGFELRIATFEIAIFSGDSHLDCWPS
jgi:hypothetical protein